MKRSTFSPTFRGQLYTVVRFTDTGRTIPSKPVAVRYSVVRIRYQSRTTSVRTDQSGSQGRAEEELFDARLLMESKIEPDLGMQIKLGQHWFTVQEVQPRYDAVGYFNHWQVDLNL